MTTQQMEPLEIKLKLVRMVIADAEMDYRGQPGIEMMLKTLQAYEHLLVRSVLKMQTDLEEIKDMQKAVRFAATLIQTMVSNERQLMAGWYHRAPAKNEVQALASLLATIMTECTSVVQQFKQKYPRLIPLLDSANSAQVTQ